MQVTLHRCFADNYLRRRRSATRSVIALPGALGTPRPDDPRRGPSDASLTGEGLPSQEVSLSPDPVA